MNIQARDTQYVPLSADQPWGQSASLTERDRFRVRHLVIYPGRALNLQSHFHRAEHWVIVSGSGRVTIGGDTRDLFENQSVDVPIGTQHRLENHGKVDLHLIEVSTGAYLGEDDVVSYG